MNRPGQVLYVKAGAKFGWLDLEPGCLDDEDGTTVKFWNTFDYAYDAAGTGPVVTNANEMKDGVLEIPTVIDGMSVVEIGDGAFMNRSDLKKVVVPDSVVRIGDSSFRDSANIREVTFGANVQELGMYVFSTTRSQLVTNVTFAGAAPLKCGTLGLSTNSTIYETEKWTDTAETFQGCHIVR